MTPPPPVAAPMPPDAAPRLVVRDAANDQVPVTWRHLLTRPRLAWQVLRLRWRWAVGR